ncbi:MAG: sucrose synthase [Nitrospinaceae bacterium]|nr:MAG: sucrose synthase [Nitrospinaceae bacterium]
MSQNILLSTILPSESGHLFREFIYELNNNGAKHLLRNEILLRYADFCDSQPDGPEEKRNQRILASFLSKTQEIILSETCIVVFYRENIANYRFYAIRNDDNIVEQWSAEEFIDFREKFTGVSSDPSEKKLLIDFQPFYSTGPTIRDYKKIGAGQRVLTSFMAGKLHDQMENWRQFLCDFLKIHSIDSKPILVDGSMIKDSEHLFEALQKAIRILEQIPPKGLSKTVSRSLKTLGFCEGFGNSSGRILETMRLLSDLIEEPNPDILESFVARIPMISKVAIVSPHGWFGQENVLGRPDTGGQIVYILDQIRALENYLATNLRLSGLDIIPKIIVLTRLIPENDGTRSNERLEKIHGTENSWILRVPFYDSEMRIVPHWISRFHIWPYLEQFALDSKAELLTEFNGTPDMIVGNYSDGNLVASLLSSWLQVIQCNIAHALEKSKYLFSDLYWQEMEKEYNFSLQFTADLISMNKADIVIASTFQEIAGTETVLGQYESYYLFSMPNLYKVNHGTNLFHPKFNVVSPGVNENVFFPYFKQEERLPNRTRDLMHLLFTNKDDDIYGELNDPSRPPLFTMARLDKIKNITGLVESYGINKALQNKCNLIVVAGTLNSEKTHDDEEKHEIQRMYELIEKYQLQGKIRWLGIRFNKVDTGEIYRIMGDRRGVFVQPALFEAFGLTVLEAMATGLPTFATQFGGPLEIIENNKNGFWINPTQSELLTKPVVDFFDALDRHPEYWNRISKAAVARVRKSYTWQLYSERLIKSAKLYGFWNYSGQVNEKKEIDHYCNLIFHLIYKKRAEDLNKRNLASP